MREKKKALVLAGRRKDRLSPVPGTSAEFDGGGTRSALFTHRPTEGQVTRRGGDLTRGRRVQRPALTPCTISQAFGRLQDGLAGERSLILLAAGLAPSRRTTISKPLERLTALAST